MADYKLIGFIFLVTPFISGFEKWYFIIPYLVLGLGYLFGYLWDDDDKDVI
ncbi:hypothetical protein SAG0136_04335 [Streptococcus agalactiae LMG 14747]|uniref:Uncharacterized protein n=2 Tax=Streptococcus TaxID=1301 RepID=V6Z0K6_STRAG|nr:hypothetical protein [Streptococcus acidominimus]ESV54490.1 hypothetical protein SAG0136_04335 [Streptococcus agalactiae LMG 14747]SNV44566.1 Uncharacterised protein [Streptococcus acidominimus]